MNNTYPDLPNNLPDLWLKTHVKHAISLINNKVGGSTQVGLVVLEQVNQTAWRCNADLSACHPHNSNCKLTSANVSVNDHLLCKQLV